MQTLTSVTFKQTDTLFGIQAAKEDAGRAYVNVSPIAIGKAVIEKSGFLGTNLSYSALYKGLDAAIMRQFVYCSARLGVYKKI